MSKRMRVLQPESLARLLRALDQETVEFSYHAVDFSGCGTFSLQKTSVYAGGVRLWAAAEEFRAILDENAELRRQLDREQDVFTAKVRSGDSKLTILPGGSVTIDGGSVIVSGPVRVEASK